MTTAMQISSETSISYGESSNASSMILLTPAISSEFPISNNKQNSVVSFLRCYLFSVVLVILFKINEDQNNALEAIWTYANKKCKERRL